MSLTRFFNSKNDLKLLTGLFFAFFIAVGLFNEYLACGAAALLSVFLIFKFKSVNKVNFYINATSISCILIAAFYLISVLYAVDSGMAFIGFVKWTPVLLFLIAIMQYDDARSSLLRYLPYLIAAVTAVCAVLSFFKPFSSYFVFAGRFAGFLQYPNTFAILLLICELILVSNFKKNIFDILTLLVFIGGIIYTGSRTAFAIAIVANFAFVFFIKNRKVKISLLTGTVVAVAGVIVIALIADNEVIDRLLKFSANSSTLNGRLLYYLDALPVILKHPFGTGYLGYFYMQQSIQTGVYSVMFIHNDLLQLILDIGWVPGIALVVAVVKTVFAKGTEPFRRIAVSALCLHSLFEFNLQFIAIFCLLVLLLDYNKGEKKVFKVKGAALFAVAVIGVLGIYMSIALGLSYFRNYAAADALYPYNTQNKISLLTRADTEEANDIADSIIAQNEYVAVSYSAKARYAYKKGDFGNVIIYKRKVYEVSPFNYADIKEYGYMLASGIELYNKAGDTKSAEVCKKELKNIPVFLNAASEKVSFFGKRIYDQPTTELPKDLTDYMEAME